MIDPVLRREPAAMVRGDDERRPVAVLADGLERIPEVGDEAVREMEIVEQTVVAACVRPVVRLAEAEPEHPRLILSYERERDARGQDVVAALLPELHDVLAQSA